MRAVAAPYVDAHRFRPVVPRPPSAAEVVGRTLQAVPACTLCRSGDVTMPEPGNSVPHGWEGGPGRDKVEVRGPWEESTATRNRAHPASRRRWHRRPTDTRPTSMSVAYPADHQDAGHVGPEIKPHATCP